MNRVYRRFRDRVQFVVVYIKEIHPTDGWQVKENEKDAVLFRQHRSMEERVQVGEACMVKMALEMPAVVDEMDDAVTKNYAAMPERLFLIGSDGKVAYRGGMGPMFFRPKEWEAAIAGFLGEAT